MHRKWIFILLYFNFSSNGFIYFLSNWFEFNIFNDYFRCVVKILCSKLKLATWFIEERPISGHRSWMRTTNIEANWSIKSASQSCSFILIYNFVFIMLVEPDLFQTNSFDVDAEIWLFSIIGCSDYVVCSSGSWRYIRDLGIIRDGELKQRTDRAPWKDRLRQLYVQ